MQHCREFKLGARFFIVFFSYSLNFYSFWLLSTESELYISFTLFTPENFWSLPNLSPLICGDVCDNLHGQSTQMALTFEEFLRIMKRMQLVEFWQQEWIMRRKGQSFSNFNSLLDIYGVTDRVSLLNITFHNSTVVIFIVIKPRLDIINLKKKNYFWRI